jgi:hypothetical protein
MRTFLAFLLGCNMAFSATTNQLVQWGITFQFDAAVDYGTFANGDYWVVTPVTVTNLLPEWDLRNHGWEINPTFVTAQGFTTNLSTYSEDKRPALPFTLTTNCSLVKVISTNVETDSSYVLSAAVLTALESTPAGGGAGYFRPPYVGTNKPLYLVSDLQSSILPSIGTASNAVGLADVLADFSKCLRMDHNSGSPRSTRPTYAMKGYQPNNTPELNEAMMQLMLNDSYADKLPALIQFTQHTIDQLHVVMLGYRASDNGHNPNHRVLAAWAATMLNITEGKTYMATATNFHEDIYLSDGTAGFALWGRSYPEASYWTYIISGDGDRSIRDPYFIIDGGDLEGTGYQNIVSQSLKGQALAFILFTNMQACLPASRFNTLSNYAYRWVNTGKWATPDPVAPYDGTPENYGVTFGPDGMGSYIAGSGRFPAAHGTLKDEGTYRSEFVATMWDQYWNYRAPLPRSSTIQTLRVGTLRTP